MKRLLCLLAAFAFISGASAQNASQDVRELLRQDPTRAANLHHTYEVPEIVDTPAPEGYVPFYISHYGRHGSRYHTSESKITEISVYLDTLLAEGLLTDEGKAVYNTLSIVKEEHEDLGGILTQKGSLDHQGISQRMFERFDPVFNQQDRKDVLCISTDVQRCIQSMANFAMQLKGNSPELNISLYTGPRFKKYLVADVPFQKTNVRRANVRDSILRASLNTERIMKAWFTNQNEALRHFGKNDPAKFIYKVFQAGIIAQNLDIENPYIYKYFTEDEIYAMWRTDNAEKYGIMCASIENERISDEIGRTILKHIVSKADEALASGSTKAADLRFGHDSGLLPLISFIQIEGQDKIMHMADAEANGWYGFVAMPMASNLQLVFYRKVSDECTGCSCDNDILVKILFNEKETTIPALTTFCGPYYKWSELREYFIKLLNE